MHEIKYKSITDSINLTYIVKSNYYKRIIVSYFKVVPSQLEIPPTIGGHFYMDNTDSGIEETNSSTINFINGPNGLNFYSLTAGFTGNQVNDSLSINYSQHNSKDYLYYVEPENGLYQLIELAENNTIVDLSKMENEKKNILQSK